MADFNWLRLWWLIWTKKKRKIREIPSIGIIISVLFLKINRIVSANGVKCQLKYGDIKMLNRKKAAPPPKAKQHCQRHWYFYAHQREKSKQQQQQKNAQGERGRGWERETKYCSCSVVIVVVVVEWILQWHWQLSQLAVRKMKITIEIFLKLRRQI